MHLRAFRLSRLNQTPQMFDSFILDMFVALVLGRLGPCSYPHNIRLLLVDVQLS